jgi:hypothetical protein
MAELDVYGHLCPLFDGILRDLPGIGRGAAGDDHDPADSSERLVAEFCQFRNHDDPIDNATAQRVGHRIGLLRDLFGHETRPAALVRRGRIPRHIKLFHLDGQAKEVGHGDGVGGDRHNLVLADGDRPAGVLDKSGHVGTQEILTVTEPNHQRRVSPCANDDARLVLVHGQQGERAIKAGDNAAERLAEVADPLVLAAE